MDSDIGNFKKIFYATFFIITIELLLFKISPQIYSIFNFLPIFFIAMVMEIKIFATSVIFSILFFIFLGLKQFDIQNNIFNSASFVFSYIFFSTLVIIFFVLFNLNKKNNRDSIGDKLAYFNVICSSFLFIFLLFFFSKINLQDISNLITNTFIKLFDKSDVYNQTDIEILVERIVKILPSINFYIILITFFFNFFLANLIISKMNFSLLYNFNFQNFLIPKWYLYFFICTLLASFILDSNSKNFFNNVCILSSFIYFFSGFLYTLNFIKKYEINMFLKILLIFLLFLFLGYLLILLFFFIGFYKNIRLLFLQKN